MLAGLAVGTYLLLTKKASADVPPVTVPDALTTGYPIYYNHYHPGVKLLQKALGVKQDGWYGPQTLAAWRKIDQAVDNGGTTYEITDYDDLMNSIKYINQYIASHILISGIRKPSTLG